MTEQEIEMKMKEYADAKFDYKQMWQIRWALMGGLDEAAKKIAKQISNWQLFLHSCGSFNSQLFGLMAKSDCHNFERLRLGFPLETSLFLEWREYGDKFFEKYGIKHED